jgi:hypothetical protein
MLINVHFVSNAKYGLLKLRNVGSKVEDYQSLDIKPYAIFC